LRVRPLISLGFTLLEVTTAVLVIAILAVIAVPVYSNLQAKAQRLKCGENVKSVGLAISAYLAEHQKWPQIATESSRSAAGGTDSPEAVQWIATLHPYGIQEANWRCPTIESQIRGSGNKNALKAKRIDYAPTSFGSDPDAPRKWPKHPWLVERGAPHGTGPWILLSDGSLVTFEDIFAK
jgi:prepilin-type N-terminal cleavage/methylation domain-containing protein